jgi:hypothetical protein
MILEEPMKVYIGVELDEEKARRLAELLGQDVGEINAEQPKLVIGDEMHPLLPGVFMVEDQADRSGTLVLTGRILLRNKRFNIEIF